MPAIEIDLLKAHSVEKRDEREAARSGKPWWEVTTYERHIVIEAIVPTNIANNIGIEIGQVFDMRGLRFLTYKFSLMVVGFFEPHEYTKPHVFADVQSILFEPILNSSSEETIPFIIDPIAAALLPESLSNRPILKPTGNKSVFVTVTDYKNHVTLLEGKFPQINRKNFEKGEIEADEELKKFKEQKD